MNRLIFLTKRKINEERIKLKNLQLMRAKEIRRMNKTIGTTIWICIFCNILRQIGWKRSFLYSGKKPLKRRWIWRRKTEFQPVWVWSRWRFYGHRFCGIKCTCSKINENLFLRIQISPLHIPADGLPAPAALSPHHFSILVQTEQQHRRPLFWI